MPQTKGPTKTVQYTDWSRGMNRTAARQRMPDNQAFLLDNAQPIGPGQLQTAPPAGDPIANILAHRTLWGVNLKIGSEEVARLIAIAIDGSIVVLTTTSPITATVIAPAGTVTPECRLTVWEDGPVLFGDPTKGYFTWDGTTFLHYPFTIVGDVHNGTPIIDNIASTTGLAPGMGISGTHLAAGTEILTVDSATQITVSINGTGNDAAATLTIGAGAPTSVRDLAVFEGRVWLISALRAITFSSPNSYADFSSATGSGTAAIPDSVFVGSITRLLSALQLLWIIGPSAVNAISNVQAAVGPPTLTTFSDTNIVANVGSVLPSSVTSFFRTFLFLSPYGVYAIVGATPQKLSDDLDGLFPQLIFGTDAPAAVFTLNRVFLWAVLVTYKDPVLGPRPVLLTFGRNAWFLLSQGPITWITTLIDPATGEPQLWATDGERIFQCFAGIDGATYTISTKLFDFGAFTQTKQLLRVALEFVGGPGPPDAIQLYGESESASKLIPLNAPPEGVWLDAQSNPGIWLTALLQTGTWLATGLAVAVTSQIGFGGNYLGLRLTGHSPPFTLSGLAMEVEPQGEWTLTSGVKR